MATPVTFRNDWWAKTTTGAAMVGAHVYWLNQPAVVPSGEPAGGPAGQATLFADTTGTTQLPQPQVADAFGHVDAYLIPGFYTVAIYVNGVLYNSYTDQGVFGTGVSSLNGLQGSVNITAGSNMVVSTVGGNTIQLNALSGFPANAVTGDGLRFNTPTNDGQWDAGNQAQLYIGVMAEQDGSELTGVTMNGASASSNASAGHIFPTNNAFYGINYFNFGAGALTTTIGYAAHITGTTGVLGILSWWRLTTRFGTTLSTNCRYWHGIGVFNTASTTGNNAAALVGTNAYATDTPNKSTIGWRYSPGTDTHWQAVVITAGASPSATVVDTGVTPLNNGVQIFDITCNAAGTSLNFYINYTLVATITTNIPPATGVGNDVLAGMFFVGDNKNTANQVGLNLWYSLMSLKGQYPGF